MHPTVFFAAIGLLGVAAQWLAWRSRLPAIIFLLAAGLIVGPLTGLIAPSKELGVLAQPMIAIAVAIILIEGGLTLDLAGLRDASQGVWRVCFLAAPLIFFVTLAAAHYVAKLSWPTAAVASGILIVTGPTVVVPLLRQARLLPRPSSVLRWEAIVNDPLGALLAVIAFEVFVQLSKGAFSVTGLAALIGEIGLAAAIGFALGRLVAVSYRTTWVPEYLKAPALFALTLVGLAAGNRLLDEAGLLTVTLMGVTIANSRIASLTEIRRFKEHAATLLVSGVFILLTADVQPALLHFLDMRTIVFVALLIFAIRPLAVFVANIGSNLSWREQLLIGLVAPRGILAVATAGVFGHALASSGIPDAARLEAVVFLVVFATVVLNALGVKPLAYLLNLASEAQLGVLLVGGNNWTLGLAEQLRELDVPVMIADRDWHRLTLARRSGFQTYYGEILSEAASHGLDFGRFGCLIAATENDAYNTLVCTDFGSLFGRQQVFQIGRRKAQELDPHEVALTLGGRTLLKSGSDLQTLLQRQQEGWRFRKTKLSDEYGFDTYRSDLPRETELLFTLRANGNLVFATVNSTGLPTAGDTVVSFRPKDSTHEAA